MHIFYERFTRTIVFAVALIGLCCISSAQTTTGSIYGTLADASGAVIPHTPVVATEVDTALSHTAVSNDAGEYVFPALNPGNYEVTVKIAGFKTVIQHGIALSANQNVHVSFALLAGAQEQTIDVSAITTLVDTRESQLAETVDQQRIEDLPLNGRNAYDLVTLVPGVTNYSPDTATGSRAGVTFSTNGLPTNDDSFYVDGTSNQAYYQNGGNLLPNPDALQEFRILTSNFDAEFGRSPGGVVNVITRSGTNHFHGVAYDYLRNNIFNAKPYFQTSVPHLVQNQFGGTLGGPLLVHDRAFFFMSYQQLAIRQPGVTGATQIKTATAYERMGDFSHDPASITSKLTSQFVACGQKYVICPAALDLVAQNLLKFVPVEDLSGTFTAQQEAPAGTNQYEGLGRLDYQLTPAHQIEAMFFNSRGTIQNPTVSDILSYAGMVDYENQVNAVLADTWTISPKTLNTLRGFYTQNRYIIDNTYGTNNFMNSPNIGSQAGEGGVIGAPARFKINGYWTMGPSGTGPNDNSQLSFGLLETMNLVRGRHSIKLGGTYLWNKFAATGINHGNGIYTFTGTVKGYSTGNALADFLEGKAATLVQSGTTKQRNHNYNPSLFLQDDWQLTQRLTLNLGLRWEVIGPYVGDTTLGTFIPNEQSRVFPGAPLGLVYPGDPGVPPGGFNTPYNDIAPRLGFAYDVFGNGRTSLRGGVGIFYETPIETNTGNLTGQQPYNLAVTINQTPNLVCPYGGTVPPCPTGTSAGADPFPFIFNPAKPAFTSTAAAPATIAASPVGGGRTPYVEEYNLTLEQQFGKAWAMRLGYVGNAMRKLYISHDVNSPTYVPGAPVTTQGIDSRRPYEPQINTYPFAAINVNDPINNGSYNGLQATIRGRVGSKLNVLASYIWSKDIDYEGPFVNGLDIKLNRGLASTDLRNVFTASVIYALPDVHLWNFVGKGILSGWQINDITRIQSGSPFTVISGVDTNLDGTTNDRVDIVGNPYNTFAHTRQQKIQEYLNPASFAVPAGPYGNEQNSSIVGPMNVDTDVSLIKIFPIYETLRLQFRAEAFNAFNNVNLGNPVANLETLQQDLGTSTSQISSSGSPRILQFAVKLMF